MNAERQAAIVIAVDPGTVKCGVAVVCGPPAAVLFKTIVACEDLIDAVRPHMERHGVIAALVVGDGTGSRRVADSLSAAFAPVKICLVNEHATSEAARARYCLVHPPRGWRRFLPRGLRVPEEPYDDYVAVILAERWLAGRGKAADGTDAGGVPNSA
ncbi:MAG: hypothetical protein P4L33_04845 [Capsulimonadaceae bacterium]|nr:hypothetical protein [Capsulimonadaceae bacterium]